MKRVILALGIVFLFATCKKDVPQKQLTVNVTPQAGGSVTPSSGTYALGSNVKLLATPSAEYVFKEWTGGVTGSSNPANVIMDIDKTVSAVFEKREYPLSLTIVGSGTVKEEIIKIASSASNYKSGTTIRLTPQPSAGFQFKKWSGDDTTSKSPLDIVVSKPINLTCTFEKMAITSLKIENLLDTFIISKKHKYIVKGVYSNGATIDLSDSVKITTTTSGSKILSDKTIIAVSSGNNKIQISYNNISLEDNVYISEIEFVPVNSALKTNNKGQLRIPVVIINYLPTKDGIELDRNRTQDSVGQDMTGQFYTLERAKSKILLDKIIEKHAIEEGTKFRDFSNNTVSPFIDIDVVAYINIYEVKYNFIGVSTVYKRDWWNIDYLDIMEKINLKNYVENLGVKEVWLTTFPRERGYLSFNVDESNMASPLTGDISNSYRLPKDLPIFNKTYVMYGDNGWRGVDTDLHNRGHQLESQMAFVDKDNIWWSKFAKVGRAGNTHWCPNSKEAYDYWNKTLAKSDIMTWKPSGGNFVDVNVDTWLGKTYKFESTINMSSPGPFATGSINYSNDAQVKWFIFWWQSVPGYNNTITDGSMTTTNWWDIFYNWDEAIKNKTKLVK